MCVKRFNNIHEKKLLIFDKLKAVQFKCNTSAILVSVENLTCKSHKKKAFGERGRSVRSQNIGVVLFASLWTFVCDLVHQIKNKK